MQGARAIADALAAFDVATYGRVRFPALHFVKGAEPGVAIAQANHIAQCHLVVLVVIQKAAARTVCPQRPARGMHHQPGLRLVGRHFPQLLDADRPAGRIAPLVQPVVCNQLFAQMAASAFGKHGVFATQLHAALKIRQRLPAFVDAHIAGGDATYAVSLVIQHFGCGKAGKNVHLQALGLLGQPLAQATQADDEIALVAQRLGQQPMRCGQTFAGRQK